MDNVSHAASGSTWLLELRSSRALNNSYSLLLIFLSVIRSSFIVSFDGVTFLISAKLMLLTDRWRSPHINANSSSMPLTDFIYVHICLMSTCSLKYVQQRHWILIALIHVEVGYSIGRCWNSNYYWMWCSDLPDFRACICHFFVRKLSIVICVCLFVHISLIKLSLVVSEQNVIGELHVSGVLSLMNLLWQFISFSQQRVSSKNSTPADVHTRIRN